MDSIAKKVASPQYDVLQGGERDGILYSLPIGKSLKVSFPFHWDIPYVSMIVGIQPPIDILRHSGLNTNNQNNERSLWFQAFLFPVRRRDDHAPGSDFSSHSGLLTETKWNLRSRPEVPFATG